MEDLKALFVVATFVAGTILVGCLLLYIAVKIMMADEINKDYFLSDFYDREENESSDND